MKAYLVRRLLGLAPILFGISLLVFGIMRMLPGDVAMMILVGGGDVNQVDPKAVATLREQLGLNKPVWEQLWIFIKQILTFDWGKSWATNESVAHLFATRMPATLTVMVPILILDSLLAIPVALGVAYVRGSLTDRTIMVVDGKIQA